MTWRIYQHPSDLDDDNPAPDLDDEESVETVAAPIDPLVQLQADLNSAKTEVAEWQDRFLRKAAEFENFRKRIEKEKAEAMMLAKSSVLIEFLPILDACERALRSFSDAQNAPVSLQKYQ